MAYVPPACREVTQQLHGDTTPSVTGTDLISLKENPGDSRCPETMMNHTFLHADIHDYYWAPQANDGNDRPPTTFVAAMHHSTLNSSSSNPERLEYVMLFKDADPRWESDGIIFVKSSLNLLPGGEKFKDTASSTAIIRQEFSSKKFGNRKNQAKEYGSADSQEATKKQKPVGSTLAKQTSRRTEAVEENVRDVKEVDSDRPILIKAGQHSGTPTGDRLEGIVTNNAAKAEDDETTEPSSENEYIPDLYQYVTGPIAIFEQVRKQQNGSFRFSGYFRITHLQYLAPQSADLFRMLEQKFSTVDRFGRMKQKYRSAASWEASMSVTWAVIKMEKDEEANTKLPPPSIKIKKVEDQSHDKTKETVKELLEEMRLKD